MNALGLEMFYTPERITTARNASRKRAQQASMLQVHAQVWKLLDNELTAHQAQAKLTTLKPRNHIQQDFINNLSDFIAGDSDGLLGITQHQYAA